MLRVKTFHQLLALVLVLMASSGAQACLFFCNNTSDYANTRYPVVLVTGITGTPQSIGFIPTEYFYGIEADLESAGARVHVASVSPVHSDFVRGEQLNTFVDHVLALEGAGKVHLIGHSQGGLTSRYVAGIEPHKVASVTTIGTPNDQPELIDFIAKEGALELINLGLLQTLGELASLIYGQPMTSDAQAVIEYAREFDEFNRLFPQGLPQQFCGEGEPVVNGVRYYSMSGNRLYTAPWDPSDALMGVLSIFAGVDSDGLVGRCESHLGKVLRDDYNMNHLDEVNGLYGMVGPFSTNPKTVFRTHLNRLKNLGL